MLLVPVLVLVVTWLLVRHWRNRPFEKLYQQTKGSFAALPIIGNLYMMICNNESKMKNLLTIGREAMKGGVLGTWFPHRLYLFIADADVAETIMKTCLEKDDIADCMHTVIGNGSIFAPVKVWRGRRKLVSPSFSLKNLKGFAKVFGQKSSIMVDNLRSAVGKGPIPMWKVFLPYSMDSLCGNLGLQNVSAQEGGNHQLIEGLSLAFNMVNERLFKPWLYNERMYKMTPSYQVVKKHISYFYDFFHAVVSEKRGKETDMCELDTEGTVDNNKGFKSFLETMVESPLNPSDLTIVEECIVLFGAASDTSAVALGYTSVLLARFPEVQEKVYQEIKEVAGDSNQPISGDNLHRLKYLDAVIRESLRLYPPVPVIARQIDRDITIPSGLTLLKGCGAMIHIWAINRNPKYWGDDADQFRPERFMESSLENPAAFMSFSYGPRNCAGLQYAMMSMKSALSKLLQRYQLVTAAEDHTHQPIEVTFKVMMRAVDDYLISIEPRTSSNLGSM